MTEVAIYLPDDQNHVDWLHIKKHDYIYRAQKRVAEIKETIRRSTGSVVENIDEYSDDEYAYLLFARKLLELLLKNGTIDNDDVLNLTAGTRHEQNDRCATRKLTAKEAFKNIEDFVQDVRNIIATFSGEPKHAIAMYATEVFEQRRQHEVV